MKSLTSQAAPHDFDIRETSAVLEVFHRESHVDTRYSNFLSIHTATRARCTFPSKPLSSSSTCLPVTHPVLQFPNLRLAQRSKSAGFRSISEKHRPARRSLEIIYPAGGETETRDPPGDAALTKRFRGLFIPFGAFRRAASPSSSFTASVFSYFVARAATLSTLCVACV